MSKVLLETFIKEAIKASEDHEDISADKITWGMLSDVVKSVIKKEKKEDALSFLYDKFKLITPTWVNVTLKGVEKSSEFIAKFLAKAYNINGKESSDGNPFEIDPNISKLIDDDVEEKFINALSWECKTYDRNKLIKDFNMTQKLHDWLASDGRSEYGGANITSDNITKKAPKETPKKAPKETPKETPKKLSPWENN